MKPKTALRKARRIVSRIQRMHIAAAKRGGNSAISAPEYFEQARICKRALQRLSRAKVRDVVSRERYRQAGLLDASQVV